jgi:NADH:ubiquinone oxidoreductase subunit 3 (subunit A)
MIIPYYYYLLFIVHDKIIVLIGTWRTTWENSATTRVEWDTLGQVTLLGQVKAMLSFNHYLLISLTYHMGSHLW